MTDTATAPFAPDVCQLMRETADTWQSAADALRRIAYDVSPITDQDELTDRFARVTARVRATVARLPVAVTPEQHMNDLLEAIRREIERHGARSLAGVIATLLENDTHPLSAHFRAIEELSCR